MSETNVQNTTVNATVTAERVEFTKEMKETYKILLPNMLSVHFAIISEAFRGMGYDTYQVGQ